MPGLPVASHLSLIAPNAAGSSRRSSGTSGAAQTGANMIDAFAALLRKDSEPVEQIDRTARARVDLRPGALDVSLEFDSGADERPDQPDAVAAVVDAPVALQNPQDAKARFRDLVEGLADLKAKLDAGEAVDPADLKRLDAALTELAAAFDIDLEQLPGLGDLQAMLANISPDDSSLTAKLTSALAPLAETLLNGNAAPEGTAPEQAALIKSIGDKLGALLMSLNADSVDPDVMAAFGLDAQAPLDADIEAALGKLTGALPTVDASPNGQVLGDASLDVTETDLVGTADAAKSGDSASETELKTGAVLAKPDADPDPGQHSDDKPDDKAKDSKVDATPAADTPDRTVDPLVAAQPSVPAARADAVAAPRVVQAGYQTSQQQLNLPQLAFEMARQVGDGNTRFQIRLDPAELGRIDVRLDIDASGQVNARLTVEKAETLDLMQRDQKALERALQQAGLDSSKTSLEFSLKQNNGNGQQPNQGDARQPLFGTQAPIVDETPLPTINLYRGSLTASGVNIIA